MTREAQRVRARPLRNRASTAGALTWGGWVRLPWNSQLTPWEVRGDRATAPAMARRMGTRDSPSSWA